MKSYIKFMLLGTSLLVSSLHAGGDQNNNNQTSNLSSEEKTEKLSIEKWIIMVKNLHNTIEDANNGSIESQNLVAETLIKHPQLFGPEILRHKIDIDNWVNIEKRVSENSELLHLTLKIILSRGFTFTIPLASSRDFWFDIRKVIFDTLNKKYNENKATPEEVGFLGSCYINSVGVYRDQKRGVELLHQAVKYKCSKAMFNLGTCYDKGIGVYQNKRKAVEILEEAAKLGNSSAMHSLGIHFYIGIGTIQDYEKAVKIWLQAAELGDSSSLCELGACYRGGTVFCKDNKKAVKIWLQAAELGNHISMYNLGVCYNDGIGVEKNFITALEWYLEHCKFKIDSIIRAKTTTQIKKLISLKTTRDDSYKLYGAFEEIGLVRPFDVKKGDSLGYNLGNMLYFHAVQKKLNDENSSFDREGVVPSKEKYALYSVTSYGAELFESFVSKLCSEEEFLTQQSKNINNNDVNIEEIPFKVTKIPTGFMLTNIQMSQDLTTQLTIDRLAGINDSVVSVMDLSGYTFYNIGLEAVKWMEELMYFKDRLTFAKDSIKKLTELETAPELIEHLKAHQQFAESLEENLGWAFAKSAGPRNKEFAEFIGWNG